MFHSNKEAREKMKELERKEQQAAHKPGTAPPQPSLPPQTIAPPHNPVPASVKTSYVQPEDSEANLVSQQTTVPIYKTAPSDPGFHESRVRDDVIHSAAGARPYRPPVPRQESVEKYLKRSNSTDEKLPPNW